MLKATQNMGKGLHKVCKTVVQEIYQYLPTLGDSGSEVSYLIIETRSSAEVTNFSDDINNPCLKATQKEIKNLINNQTFLLQEQEKGEPMTPCMDVYKDKIHSYGSLDKLKLRIMVRRDLKNKELVGDT